MIYLSGLDDLIDHKDEFEIFIPNIENIVNLVKNVRYKSKDDYKKLERKLVSLCFSIKMTNEDYEKINKIILKQYLPCEEGIIKYELQKLIYNYLCHIDSLLDCLNKFLNELRKTDIKYQRKYYDFDKLINNLRNEVIHEGIPTIYVTFPDSDYDNNFTCCQWAGEIKSEQGLYIELEIDNRKYDLQKLIDTTYNPLMKTLKKIISLIN